MRRHFPSVENNSRNPENTLYIKGLRVEKPVETVDKPLICAGNALNYVMNPMQEKREIKGIGMPVVGVATTRTRVLKH